MKLIAKKPCSFGGKRFYVGDKIPLNLVLDPAAQEKMGVLAIVKEDTAVNPDGSFPVEWNFSLIIKQGDGGAMMLDFDLEGMTGALSALISKPDDAVAIIEEMTCNDALIYLHMADNRKTVKAAAEARAKSLQEEAGEQ